MKRVTSVREKSGVTFKSPGFEPAKGHALKLSFKAAKNVGSIEEAQELLEQLEGLGFAFEGGKAYMTSTSPSGGSIGAGVFDVKDLISDKNR